MKIVIQAVRQREDNVQKMLKHFEAQVVYDETLKGNLPTFMDCMRLKINGYRLHLQDDMIIPNGFYSYLKKVEADCIKNGFDVLSLYAPKRKQFFEAQEKGLKYSVFNNFLTMTAVVFSEKAVDGILETYSKYGEEYKDDDVFVAKWLSLSKTKAYVHLPSIVQHNAYLGSTLGHASTSSRMSVFYDKDYCLKNINTKN